MLQEFSFIMIKKLVAIFLIFCSGGISYAQDSNVSDSVRAMIERSQAANQIEQTARMQMNVQFGDFLSTLEGGAVKRSRVEAIFTEVLCERAELSSRVTLGRANKNELETVSNYQYLRDRVAPSLSDSELALLDSRTDGPSDEQLKRDYSEELSRSAPDLNEASRELVLNVLINYVRVGSSSVSDSSSFSVDDLVNQQSRSIMEAREELKAQFSGDDLRQVNTFLNRLQSNLFMNRSMSDTLR